MTYTFFGDASEIIRHWPMASALVTILFTILHIVPANLLHCYIFRRYFRYPLPSILSGLFLLLSMECVCQLLYGHIFSTRVSFIWHWIYFFYFCAMIRVSLCKQIALIVPLGLIWFLLLYIAYTTEYNWPFFPIPFMESGIVLLLEIPICTASVFYYERHFTTPLLAGDSIPELWPPLALLSLLLLILSVLATPFNEDRTFHAFLIRLASSAGGLAGTLLALHAARQAIERRQLNSILAIEQERHFIEKEYYDRLAQIEKETQLFQQNLKDFAEKAGKLLEKKDYDAIYNYANHYLDNLGNAYPARVCRNEMVNALVCYWKNVLDDLGTTCSFDISISKEDHIDPLHMTAILGSLLRNAAEALAHVPDKKNRWLLLHAVEQAHSLIITLDNSFDEPLHQDNAKHYLSSKHDFTNRGVGLDLIQSSVSHYHGNFSIETTGGVFSASILLPWPKQSEEWKTHP